MLARRLDLFFRALQRGLAAAAAAMSAREDGGEEELIVGHDFRKVIECVGTTDFLLKFYSYSTPNFLTWLVLGFSSTNPCLPTTEQPEQDWGSKLHLFIERPLG